MSLKPRENGGQEPAPGAGPGGFRMLEVRSYRPFKSSEEYLYAMKEDLAEWFEALYELDINVDNFWEVLETGVVLCRHANKVREIALENPGSNGLECPIPRGPTYRSDVSANTFHARDNVSNFITWCRALGVMDCLLFETDDLVLRKNERSVILCLLEVARRGSKVGMLAPLLVQLEEEIDREIAADSQKGEAVGTRTNGEDRATSPLGLIDYVDYGPHKQIIVSDLKSLDEMVRDLVNRCTCPTQFFIERISEGKYRIGDTKILIFVRILRSHVMVRVGGGWDTLAHYLDKHDPCRCRQGHRAAVSSKLTVKYGQGNPADTQMGVSYVRHPIGGVPRQTSPTSLPPPLPLTSPPRQRHGSSSSSSSSHKLSNTSLTSSEDAVVSAAKDGKVSSASSAEGDPPVPHHHSDEDEGYRSSASRLPSMERKNPPPNSLMKVNEGDINDLYSLDDVDAGIGSTTPSPLDQNGYDKLTPKCKSSARAMAPPHSLDVPQHSPAPYYETVIPLDFSSKGVPTSQVVPEVVRHRRLSGDQRANPNSGLARRMPRSRSSHGGDLTRNQGGRYSYRSLRGQCPAAGGNTVAQAAAERNHTWSPPPRCPSRPALTANTFTPPGGTQSADASPHRRGPVGWPQPVKSVPVARLPPELSKVINLGLHKDKKFLEMLHQIVESAGGPHSNGGSPSRQRHASSPNHSQGIASPDSGSDPGDDRRTPDLVKGVDCAHQRHLSGMRPKISPRKDNHPDTDSKIPLPNYEQLIARAQIV